MRFFHLAVLVFLGFLAKAQSIRGVVLDSISGKPIGGAVVYIDKTFKRDVTDTSGVFELVSPGTRFPIMVSSMGYHTKAIATYPDNNLLKVYLTPKPFELKMVTIGSDGMEMADKIRIFKREFLGTSSNARKCEIENIDDIDFLYDKSSGMLTASAGKPVIIHNKELGYRLQYYLTSFTYSPGLISLVGNELFEEDILGKAMDTVAVKGKRAGTYLGSRMHFIRSLWNNDLANNNFKVYDINNNSLSYSDIVGIKDDQKFIRFIPILKILYRNKSGFAQLSGEIYIDSNGFYSAGITWREDLGKKRVGDLLPFEYPGK